MFNIGNFLKRATNKQSKEIYFRKSVQDMVQNKFDVQISFDSISIKSNIIYIKNLPQAVRSTIFIKKKALLEEINRLQDIYVIKDIK